MAQQWSAITNNDIWNLNSGNIGIGTTTPDTKLHIWTWTPGITNLLKLENRYASSNTNHGEGIFFKGYYKQALIKAFQNPESFFGGDLQLQTYLDENTLNPGIYLNRLGNVGIGTITPNYKLEITGNSFVNGNLKIGTPTDNITIYNGNYGNGAIIKLPNLASGNDEISVLNTPQTYTKTKTFSNSTYSALFTGGNVGIGTTTPKSKLELVSGINAYPATTGTTQSGAALRLRGGDNAVLDFGMNSNNTWIQATNQTGLDSKYNISLNPNGGNVGIGTGIIAPIGVFDVKTSSNQHIQMLKDVNGAYPGAAGIVSINDANLDYTPMGFFAANYYFGNGNVGIGKLPTNIKLDVGGSACVDTEFSISGSGEESNGIGGEVHIYNTDKTGVGEMSRWSIYNMNGDYGNSLQFWAYDNYNTCNHRVTFQDDGNVGIGVPHPNSKLDVAGDFQTTGKIGNNLNNKISDTNNPYNGLSHYSLSWNMDPWSTSGPTLWQSAWGGMKFFTNGTPRLSITNTGKVSIGTTVEDLTDGVLLTVKGTIHAKEVLIDMNTPLADYVFDKNYQLMPLNKVEEYVNTNSHLPEIPSAAEVSKNGLSIGEMQNKLLQKVEELTLYVIEQQKQIDQLKQELKK